MVPWASHLVSTQLCSLLASNPDSVPSVMMRLLTAQVCWGLNEVTHETFRQPLLHSKCSHQVLVAIIAVICILGFGSTNLSSLLLVSFCQLFPNLWGCGLFVLYLPVASPQFFPGSRLCSAFFLWCYCILTTADLRLSTPCLSSFLLHSPGGREESRMTSWFLICRGGEVLTFDRYQRASRRKGFGDGSRNLAFFQDVYYRC